MSYTPYFKIQTLDSVLIPKLIQENVEFNAEIELIIKILPCNVFYFRVTAMAPGF